MNSGQQENTPYYLRKMCVRAKQPEYERTQTKLLLSEATEHEN